MCVFLSLNSIQYVVYWHLSLSVLDGWRPPARGSEVISVFWRRVNTQTVLRCSAERSCGSSLCAAFSLWVVLSLLVLLAGYCGFADGLPPRRISSSRPWVWRSLMKKPTLIRRSLICRRPAASAWRAEREATFHPRDHNYTENDNCIVTIQSLL